MPPKKKKGGKTQYPDPPPPCPRPQTPPPEPDSGRYAWDTGVDTPRVEDIENVEMEMDEEPGIEDWTGINIDVRRLFTGRHPAMARTMQDYPESAFPLPPEAYRDYDEDQVTSAFKYLDLYRKRGGPPPRPGGSRPPPGGSRHPLIRSRPPPGGSQPPSTVSSGTTAGTSAPAPCTAVRSTKRMKCPQHTSHPVGRPEFERLKRTRGYKIKLSKRAEYKTAINRAGKGRRRGTPLPDSPLIKNRGGPRRNFQMKFTKLNARPRSILNAPPRVCRPSYGPRPPPSSPEQVAGPSTAQPTVSGRGRGRGRGRSRRVRGAAATRSSQRVLDQEERRRRLAEEQEARRREDRDRCQNNNRQ